MPESCPCSTLSTWSSPDHWQQCELEQQESSLNFEVASQMSDSGVMVVVEVNGKDAYSN